MSLTALQYLTGVAAGIAVGISAERCIKSFYPTMPQEIVMEDRNRDGLEDITLNYLDNSIVLYSHKNKQGKIEYNLLRSTSAVHKK